MESFKLLASVLLLITEAHAWGAKSSRPVDCLITEWTSWSEPIFADRAVRTRSMLRAPANGGIECPAMTETKQTGTPVTTEQVAEAFINNFLFPHAVRRSRIKRQVDIGIRRDLLIILDASGSIGSDDFRSAIDQLVNVLELMCPTTVPFDGDIHKLAVIRYSSSATEIFNFNAYHTTHSALQAVRRIEYTGGGTNTAAAFDLARAMLGEGARRDDDFVRQEVLILTDGHSNNAPQAIAAAKLLQREAIVFGLVIGHFSTNGLDEVLQYISGPIENHLFWLPSFHKLEEMVSLVRQGVVTHQCAPFDIE